MKSLVVLVLLVRVAGAQIPTGRVEGCNYMHKPILAITCANCAEQGPDGKADYVQVICSLRHPDAWSQGWVSSCVCTYHDTDLWIGTPPGVYDRVISQCPVGSRAVGTIWRLPNGNGVDGGCDHPGPTCTPGLLCPTEGLARSAVARTAATVRLERCEVKKTGEATCKTVPPPKPKPAKSARKVRR